LNGQIFNGLAKVVRRYRALFEAMQENCSQMKLDLIQNQRETNQLLEAAENIEINNNQAQENAAKFEEENKMMKERMDAIETENTHQKMVIQKL
jgi:predicted nuclease with TOPRIM domain